MRNLATVAAITAVCILPLAALLAMVETTTFGILSVYLVSIPATLVVLVAAYFTLKRSARRVDPSGDASPRAAIEKRVSRMVQSQAVWWLVLMPLLFLPGNAVLLLNQWLDRSSAVAESYVIQSKGRSGSGSFQGNAYFVLTPGGASGAAFQDYVVILDRSIYDRVVPQRSKVVMTIHRGAFGFPWTAGEPRWADLAPQP